LRGSGIDAKAAWSVRKRVSVNNAARSDALNSAKKDGTGVSCIGDGLLLIVWLV